MTHTLAEHQNLNGMYILGRKARSLGWPICACPRNLDKPHREEWLRGYREQEGNDMRADNIIENALRRDLNHWKTKANALESANSTLEATNAALVEALEAIVDLAEQSCELKNMVPISKKDQAFLGIATGAREALALTPDTGG